MERDLPLKNNNSKKNYHTMMEEKKNKKEEYSEDHQNQELTETGEPLMDPGTINDPEAVTGSEEEQTDRKKERGSKSKHTKEEKIEELEEEVVNLNDKYLRLYSEFDNFRKRSIKERIELGKSAASDLTSSILPVLDDFERAIKAMETSGDSSNHLADGIVLIYNKIKTILGQQGLEPMKAMGEPFNTDFHEAVTNFPSPEPEMKGKVVDVIEKGYLLNGKVIRYAKVVVGS